MDRVRTLVRRVAHADATVLIRGDTGTGKEMVARAIHELSPRCDEPFVAINCAALPHSLMESLIFGHERGAFTGAAARARGQLELAGTGTILLDEIAEMPLDLQAKLLRVLEDRAFRPLGAAKEMTLSARVLVATHADLEERIRQGRFREDLFFRINVIAITLPPLSERRGDIPALVHAMTSELPRKLRFSEQAMDALVTRKWPGNVRELRNVIERVSILAEQDLVTPDVLDDLDPERSVVSLEGELERTVALLLSFPGKRRNLDLIERVALQTAMRMRRGNKSKAAELLGVERRILVRRWQRMSETDAEPGEDDDVE
jgi:two-component system response regulator HydG